MTSQHTGNRPQIVVDDRTQLLAPVVPDDVTRRILDGWEAECRKTGTPNWILDRAALTAPYRLGYGWGPRREDETAVIPVTPAQPEADWDRGDDPLPCGKKIRAIGLLLGAGMVLGAALLTAGVIVGAVVF